MLEGTLIAELARRTGVKIAYEDFDPDRFSFFEDPLLILEGFWTDAEMARFRRAMGSAHWTTLAAMPKVSEQFPHCGDWEKAEMAVAERAYLTSRVFMPFVQRHVETFPRVRRGVLGFNYYAYGVGDCLTVHDDVDSGDDDDASRERVRRRIALTTYVHERWEPNWGGELMIYDRGEGPDAYEIRACVAPEPGSLVMFTVPRSHRVCRVDPLAGIHRRLSISGWFMTEHEE